MIFLDIKDISKQLPRHTTKRYSKRDLRYVDKIIIHHSATRQGKAASFARYHVNNLGWPGIGYHMVGDSSGVYQTNPLDIRSYHCRGQNTRSIGICHTGSFDKDAPLDIVYWQLIKMVIHVDLLMKKKLPIHYHNQHSTKTCPGTLFNYEYFESELERYRSLHRPFIK